MTAKELSKRVALVGLAVLGYALMLPLWRRLRMALRGPELRILTYHSVGGRRGHETDVAAEAFDAQMALIARITVPIALSEAVGRLAGKAALPSLGAVSVTLDDGYADNLFIAWPLMACHGVPGACFVTAGYVGSGRLLPHDDGQATSEEDRDACRLLGWDEVAGLARQGMEIGSHGLRHARFAALDGEGMRREAEGSRALILEKAGVEARVFSFPYGHAGDCDGRAAGVLAAAGYEAACTARYGWNTRGADLWALRRIGVESSDTLFTVRAKLNGALDLLVLCETRWGRRLVAGWNRAVGG